MLGCVFLGAHGMGGPCRKWGFDAREDHVGTGARSGRRGGLTCPSGAAARPAELSEAQVTALSALAQNYLEERAERITTKSTRGARAFSKLHIGPELRVKLGTDVANIDELRSRLEAAGPAYTDAKVSVDVESSSFKDGRAVLGVRETTYLYEGVTEEGYGLDHQLTFSRISGIWRLDKAVLVRQDGLLPPTQTQGEWKEGWKSVEKAIVPQDRTGPAAGSVPVGVDAVPKEDSYAPTSVSFDKGDMAAYARKYALNYNDNYREYSNDCTNFMSQAVHAGGWWMINSGYDRDDYRRWNYGQFQWTTSYTWAGAHNFYNFGKWSTRTSTTSKSKLRIGDLVHIKFSGSKRIHHSMMVTLYWSGSSSPHPKLSYHTTDYLNRPLWKIQAQYPPSRHTYYYRKMRA